MSTQPPNTAPPIPKGNVLSRYYRGPSVEGTLGGFVRGMIMGGKQVAMGERMRQEENREFFRGNQWIRYAPDQRTITMLNRNTSVPSGRPSYNSYNRYRSNINARISLLTNEPASFEVIPEDNDSDSIDAGRQAEKFLMAHYGNGGWGISQKMSELAKNGDIDGIAWLSVEWDPRAGTAEDQMVPVTMDGKPVKDRETYEALKAMDPNMETLWTMGRSKEPVGDVVWRVVLPGALSVDPFMVKSFDDAKWICESRLMPRADIEREMGKGYKEMVAASQNKDPDGIQYEDLALDGGGTMSERNGVVVHFFYHKPDPSWPKGVYVKMLDKAPDQPLLVTDWEDDLPYYPYTPSPDPGHLLRSRGVGDDLKPVQRDYNQTLRDLALWKNKMACSPVMMPVGSMRSPSFFREEGYIEFIAAQGEPRQYNVPSEPTAVFTTNLQWMAMEMERLSGVSSLSQGFSMPNGPEATSGIQMQLQQTEQNLSEAEKNLNAAEEWGCNRSMKIVRKRYTIARTVTGVGVDDAEQFKAFEGSMLRGGRYRINAPRMPKSKAARMQSILQFSQVQGMGDRFAPYMGQLIDGDPTGFQSSLEIDVQHQKDETRQINALATDEMAVAVFENFEAFLKEKWAPAMAAAGQQAAAMPPDPITGQGINPEAILASKGILPPNLTRDMQNAGIKVPAVDLDNDNHFIEHEEVNKVRKSATFKALHPLCQQLLRDHMNGHKEGMNRQVTAMAQQQPQGEQQGSKPAEKGQPSPPKNQPTKVGSG